MTNTVTEEQIANLRNHAAFVAKLPDIKMHAYASRNDVLQVFKPLAVANECGSPMCAIGFAAVNPAMPRPRDNEGWAEYSERIFGISNEDDWGGYCFSGELPDDPVIISELMLEVADELESTQ